METKSPKKAAGDTGRLAVLVILTLAALAALGMLLLQKQNETGDALPPASSENVETEDARGEEDHARELEIESLKNTAASLIAEGKYDEAYALLEQAEDHAAVIQNLKDRAAALIGKGDYNAAYALLEQAGAWETIAENRYDRARELMARETEENFEAAAALLTGLDYSDSEALLARVEIWLEEHRAKPLSADAQEGDRVLFGRYEQDNDASNGAEPIEWIVLSRMEGRAVMISRYALHYDDADTSDRAATGSRWLANDFITTAFTSQERSCLLAEGSYVGFNNMRAFLPTSSIAAASDDVRICCPTEAALRASGQETAQPVTYLGADRVSIYSDNYTLFRINETGQIVYTVNTANSSEPAFIRPMIVLNPGNLPQ